MSEGEKKSVRAFEHGTRPEKSLAPSARVQADAAPPSRVRRLVQAPSRDIRMIPPAMLPAMQARPTVASGRAERGRYGQPLAAMAPKHAGGMKSRLVDECRRDQLRRHIVSRPRRCREGGGAPVGWKRSHAASTAGNDDRSAVHRPPSKVVVEVFAPWRPCRRSCGVLGAKAARVPDRGAGTPVRRSRRAPGCNRSRGAATQRPPTSIRQSSQRSLTLAETPACDSDAPRWRAVPRRTGTPAGAFMRGESAHRLDAGVLEDFGIGR